jgi:FSR family fosmidomycin resistance protein-like MFS transporter
MSIFKNRQFSSVVFGHLMVDVINGQRGVLLTFLSISLGMTNSTLAAIATTYNVVGALAQPVSGFLTDRFGPRWFAAGGVLWMAAFFSLAVTTPGWTGVVFFIIASMGSGAFHPAGSTESTKIGLTQFPGKETTVASVFFFFGQLGWSLGPLVGGPLIDLFGPQGLLVFAIFAIPVGVFSAISLPARQRISEPKQASPASAEKQQRINGWILTALVVVAACQAWMQQNVNTFMPKFLADQGYSASIYGLVSAVYMAGAAVGSVAGGVLADRIGKPRTIFVTMGVASIASAFLAWVGYSPVLFVLMFITGASSGAAYSAIVVLAQRIIPGGMAFASGLVLGFLFACGAMGTLLSGVVADQWGFAPVFTMTAGIAMTAAMVSFLLHEPC